MIRHARIATDIVQVLCPYCGAECLNKDGTADWTKEDVKKADCKVVKCDSCDKQLKIMTQSRAQID